MKTIKYMIAAGIISAALITGCNKENSLESGLTGTAAATNGSANVTYQLRTLLPPAGTLIKWDKGSITSSGLFFYGSHLEGNMVSKETFEGKGSGTWDLFSNPVLGTVNVPFNNYLGVSLAVGLNPLNGTNSLSLSGVFGVPPTGNIAVPAQPIPVQVIINEPIVLNTVWTSNVVINQPAYAAAILLDMNGITNGIDAAMLENAQATNGTIFITSNSNQNLYGIIVANLQNNMINVEFSPGLTKDFNVNTQSAVSVTLSSKLPGFNPNSQSAIKEPF